MESQYIMALWYPQSEKSQGFKSGDLGGQVVGICCLIILSSLEWRWSSCFTQRPICGGAPSWINAVVLSYRLYLRAEITDYFSNEAYRWLVTVHFTLSVVWNECTANIIHTRITSLQFPTARPPRSPDLYPCGYWLRIPQDHGLPWSHHIFIRQKENVERHVCIIPQFMLLSKVEYAILRF